MYIDGLRLHIGSPHRITKHLKLKIHTHNMKCLCNEYTFAFQPICVNGFVTVLSPPSQNIIINYYYQKRIRGKCIFPCTTDSRRRISIRQKKQKPVEKERLKLLCIWCTFDRLSRVKIVNESETTGKKNINNYNATQL